MSNSILELMEKVLKTRYRSKKKKRLLEDFIIPALNSRKFGQFLEWVDPQEHVFRVLFLKQNAQNGHVFVAWDKLKGRVPDTVGYFSRCRQRFHVALAKCPRLHKIQTSGEKHAKVFKIIPARSKVEEADIATLSNVSDISCGREATSESEGFILPDPVEIPDIKEVFLPVPIVATEQKTLAVDFQATIESEGFILPDPVEILDTKEVFPPVPIVATEQKTPEVDLQSQSSTGVTIKAEPAEFEILGMDQIKKEFEDVPDSESPSSQSESQTSSLCQNHVQSTEVFVGQKPVISEAVALFPAVQNSVNVIRPAFTMSQPGKSLLIVFIISSLNAGIFGEFLKWINEEKTKFKVMFLHKNSHKWSKCSADVFVAWDKFKGRLPEAEDYYTKSRQRFRTALADCPDIERLPSNGEKNTEFYRIVPHRKKRKIDTSVSGQSSAFTISDHVGFPVCNYVVVLPFVTSQYSSVGLRPLRPKPAPSSS